MEETIKFPAYMEIKKDRTPKEQSEMIELVIKQFGDGNYSNPINVQINGEYKTVVIHVNTLGAVHNVFDVLFKKVYQGQRGKDTIECVINKFVDETDEAHKTILCGSKHLGGSEARLIIIEALRKACRLGVIEKFNTLASDCYETITIKNFALAEIQYAVGMHLHDINQD